MYLSIKRITLLNHLTYCHSYCQKGFVAPGDQPSPWPSATHPSRAPVTALSQRLARNRTPAASPNDRTGACIEQVFTYIGRKMTIPY
jgi:hypothetical protein